MASHSSEINPLAEVAESMSNIVNIAHEMGIPVCEIMKLLSSITIHIGISTSQDVGVGVDHAEAHFQEVAKIYRDRLNEVEPDKRIMN